MKDQLLKHRSALFNLVLEENDRQIKKWGKQNRSPFEWLTYITEEVGELAKAISENEYRQGPDMAVVSEAIQTATLCLKVAEMYLIKKPSARRPLPSAGGCHG